MSVGPEDHIERMGQPRIRLVLLDEDRFEDVLPLRIRRAGEAQHLGSILPGIGDIQIAVRPEGKPAQLPQLDPVRQGVGGQRLAQRLPAQVIGVDIVPLVRVIAAVEGEIPAPHAFPLSRRPSAAGTP
jgi:hypothetical protein